MIYENYDESGVLDDDLMDTKWNKKKIGIRGRGKYILYENILLIKTGCRI